MAHEFCFGKHAAGCRFILKQSSSIGCLHIHMYTFVQVTGVYFFCTVGNLSSQLIKLNCFAQTVKLFLKGSRIHT